MILLAVDDERFALKDLEEALAEAVPGAQINGFLTPGEALEFAVSNPVDVAFLDIELGSMNGLELAKKLKDMNGATNIVFTTGFSDYAAEAFAMYASGYLLKPVRAKKIKEAMDHLRTPVGKAAEKGMRVQTFGNFEVFVNGYPLHFPRSKAKELFAYLVHKNGSGCSLKELTAVLFEDKEYNASLQNQMQTIVSVMMKTLQEVNMQDTVIKNFNSLSVDVSKIDCDYYRFLKWDTDAINSYTGEYMDNYSWAEFTAGFLDNKLFNEPAGG